MKTWHTFLVQSLSCAFLKWKSKNTKRCQEESRILDKWLLKLGSSFNKGNKNEEFTKVNGKCNLLWVENEVS